MKVVRVMKTFTRQILWMIFDLVFLVKRILDSALRNTKMVGKDQVLSTASLEELKMV